jgi:hypothetical protein
VNGLDVGEVSGTDATSGDTTSSGNSSRGGGTVGGAAACASGPGDGEISRNSRNSDGEKDSEQNGKNAHFDLKKRILGFFFFFFLKNDD